MEHAMRSNLVAVIIYIGVIANKNGNPLQITPSGLAFSF